MLKGIKYHFRLSGLQFLYLRFFYVILLCSVTCFFSCKKDTSGGNPNNESGSEVRKLDKDWYFYPSLLLFSKSDDIHTTFKECKINLKQSISCGEFSLTSESLQILTNKLTGHRIDLPHTWVDSPFSEDLKDGTGYGIYAKTINISPGRYGIYTKNWLFNSAGRIWVFKDGTLTLLQNIGTPGYTEAGSREEALGVLAFHEFLEGESRILIEVSNFQYRTGYLNGELYLTSVENAKYEMFRYLFKEGSIAGVLIISGLYHITLYLLRKKLFYALFFGIFSLMMGIRVIIVARILQIFYPDSLSYEWMNRIEYLTFILPPAVFLTYFRYLFQENINSKIYYFIIVTSGISALFVLLFSSLTFSRYFSILHIPMLTSILYAYFTILSKIFSKDNFQKKIARILVGVFMLYSFTLLYDLLMYVYQWIPLELSGIGLVLFILGQSIVIAGISASALETAERLTKKLEKEVELRTAQYREEYKKSESLLLNILPSKVASELKVKGKTTPEYFESVSVCFTDFVGFTKIAESMKPSELVSELDDCFSFFDYIIGKYNLEKLKTIGDSYMFAGGIPIPSSTHAIDCILASLEIQSFMSDKITLKNLEGSPYWELRLGINSGSLIAGVIGNKKFTYDIWSDTVNTASRCESSGIPGKINISKNTYNLVSGFFDCEYRGSIPVKNKGNVDMYTVIAIKPELALEGLPGPEFWKKYEKVKNI